MDGWMDGWMDGYLFIRFYLFIYYLFIFRVVTLLPLGQCNNLVITLLYIYI